MFWQWGSHRAREMRLIAITPGTVLPCEIPFGVFSEYKVNFYQMTFRSFIGIFSWLSPPVLRPAGVGETCGSHIAEAQESALKFVRLCWRHVSCSVPSCREYGCGDRHPLVPVTETCACPSVPPVRGGIMASRWGCSVSHPLSIPPYLGSRSVQTLCDCLY